MTPTKTLGIAIGIAFATSSFAFAQGNPAANAAASGGPGTHQSTQKTGSAANTQKVIQNQNGYGLANNGMPPASYKGPGAMQSYPVQSSNTAANAAESGGPGTHQSTQKTGSAANTQKVIHNQNGYRGLYGSVRGHHKKMVRR